MTIEFKDKVRDAINEWVQPGNNERSQNALANKAKVSAATISLIKNGSGEYLNGESPIQDQHFLLLAKFLGIHADETAPAVLHWETANFLRIQSVCQLAQSQGRRPLIDGESGAGKTYALEYYAQNHDRVHYLKCTSSMRKKDMLHEIMSLLKISTDGLKGEKQWMDAIKHRLIGTPGQLIILDETEDIPVGLWKAIKEIEDFTRGICGLVVAGLDLEAKLKLLADKKKPGFRQMKRRLFPNIVKVNTVGRAQIKDVLMKMGITEKDVTEWFVRKVTDYDMLNQWLSDALKVAGNEPITVQLLDELFSI